MEDRAQCNTPRPFQRSRFMARHHKNPRQCSAGLKFLLFIRENTVYVEIFCEKNIALAEKISRTSRLKM